MARQAIPDYVIRRWTVTWIELTGETTAMIRWVSFHTRAEARAFQRERRVTA